MIWSHQAHSEHNWQYINVCVTSMINVLNNGADQINCEEQYSGESQSRKVHD